jgi:hypothetical protein
MLLKITLVIAALFLLFIPNIDINSAAITEIKITEIMPFGNNYPDGCKTNIELSRCSFDKWFEVTNFGTTSFISNNFNVHVGISKESFVINNINIAPDQSIIISYSEKDYNGLLSRNSLTPTFTSGKVRDISSRERMSVDIEISDSNILLDSVHLTKNSIDWVQVMQGHTIELYNNKWAINDNTFDSLHYATPFRFVTPANKTEEQVTQTPIIIPVAQLATTSITTSLIPVVLSSPLALAQEQSTITKAVEVKVINNIDPALIPINISQEKSFIPNTLVDKQIIVQETKPGIKDSKQIITPKYQTLTTDFVLSLVMILWLTTKQLQIQEAAKRMATIMAKPLLIRRYEVSNCSECTRQILSLGEDWQL